MAAKRLAEKNGNNWIWITEGQNYKVTTTIPKAIQGYTRLYYELRLEVFEQD